MDRRIAHRITAIILLLGPVACAVGCGAGKYGSPEATFETAKAAAKAKDWKAMWDCYTAESVDTMAGMMVLAGGFAGEKTAAVLEKHGVEKPGPGIMAEALKSGKSPNDMGKDLAKGIGDKTQFIADMQDAMQQQSGNKAPQFKEDAQLEGLTIDGDSASAKVAFEGKSIPVKFKNINGEWKLDLVIPTLGKLPED
jgi:hypothetical protein